MTIQSIRPCDYDGMESVTADGSIRFRTYEPSRWQLGRKLLWLWWRLRSKFTSRPDLAAVTIVLADGTPLELRAVVVQLGPFVESPQLDRAAESLGVRRRH